MPYRAMATAGMSNNTVTPHHSLCLWDVDGLHYIEQQFILGHLFLRTTAYML